MNYLTILQSINKIAIVAFFIILFFIGIEMSWILKGKKKEEKIKIPDFTSKFGQSAKVASVDISNIKPSKKKSNLRILWILLLSVLLIGLVIAFILFFISNEKPSQNQTNVPIQKISPVVEMVESEGIVLFSKDWKKLNDSSVTLTVLDPIFIGVKTISGVNIDKARIRVNKNTWDKSDETILFDSAHNVYYSEFTISTNESKLKIDAQLHSKEDGWLTE